MEKILERSEFSEISKVLSDAKTIKIIKTGVKGNVELSKKVKE